MYTADSERLRIDSSGRVGIGTSSPTSVLDIRDTQTGAASEIKLFNLDQGNTTTQTSALVMTPDVRANGAKISVVKENADFSSSANKDVAITFSPVINNTATERMRIDSSGNVGVGATPSAWGGSRKAIQFDSGGAAYICNDSTVGIVSNMYFDGSNNKYINAGTASSVYFGQDNVLFQFASSGSANGNATFSTAATIDVDGVKFQGDTAAANALDDYEEGTWTPVYSPASGSYTPFTQIGKYIKIGAVVHVFASLSNNGSSSPSGVVQVSGLPFTTGSTGGSWGISSGHGSAYGGHGFPKDQTNLSAGAGTTNINFRDDDGNALNASNIGTSYNSGQLSFSLTYTTT